MTDLETSFFFFFLLENFSCKALSSHENLLCVYGSESSNDAAGGCSSAILTRR